MSSLLLCLFVATVQEPGGDVLLDEVVAQVWPETPVVIVADVDILQEGKQPDPGAWLEVTKREPAAQHMTECREISVFDAQGMLEFKISKLEEMLSNARLVDESKLDNSKVLVLSTVKIKNKKLASLPEIQSVLSIQAQELKRISRRCNYPRKQGK